MWSITKVISNYVDAYIPEEKKVELMKQLYYSMNGGHFNKHFAEQVISNMYFIDENGVKHPAPYWTEQEMKDVYNRVFDRIPAYNFWDFAVTLNMVKSDNCNKLHRWFPEATKQELMEKIVDEAVNYLDDEDNPFGEEKPWRYLNS